MIIVAGTKRSGTSTVGPAFEVVFDHVVDVACEGSFDDYLRFINGPEP